MSDKFDDFNNRLRICEDAIENDTKTKTSKPKQKVASTPYTYLPYGLPSEFSKSVLSPDNSCLQPRKIFPEQKDNRATEENPFTEEMMIEDDALEDISTDDLLEEVCISDNKNENQSFLGVGPKNPSKF